MPTAIFISRFAVFYLSFLLLWARFCPLHFKIRCLALLNLASYGIVLFYYKSGVLLIYIYLLLLVAYNTQRFFGEKRFGKLCGVLIPLTGIFAFQYLIPKLTGQSCSFDIFNIEPGEYLALGLSYICFRMLLFVFETQQSTPTLSDYLAYTLFLPSCLLGPLTDSRLFLKSIRESSRELRLRWSSFERLMWGFLKATLISGIFDRISYQGIIFDGNSHSPWALLLASVGFYLYLYFNFSGVCDIVISISSISGIHLDENFNKPLLSTNLPQFWRSWHITLGRLFRNLVYAPLSLLGLRYSRGKSPFFWSAIANLVTFIAIGLWHGLAWKWLVFGLMHGVGIVVHSGFSQIKLRFLRKEFFFILFNSKIYAFMSWVLTQLYVAASMIFFANELSRLFSLLTILVW